MERPKLLEDNATNALHTILMGNNLAEAKFLYEFLTSKKTPEFEEIDTIVTREKQGDSTPDITIKFNNGEVFNIETKTRDSKLTHTEKDPNKRHVFLIPKGYRYETKITRVPILYWEDLFFRIDTEHGGDGFEELITTRNMLEIPNVSSYEFYKAKALEVFCRLTRKDECIKFGELSELWEDTEKYQGMWITLYKMPIIFSFEKKDTYVEYEYKTEEEMFKIKDFSEIIFADKYKSDFYENKKTGIKTFYIDVMTKNKFLEQEITDIVDDFYSIYEKFLELLKMMNEK